MEIKIVKEHINEKFTESGDPIKDMGIGALRVFVIEVDLPEDEWQVNEGIDIVIARNEEEAKNIWRKHSPPYYYDQKTKMQNIVEIDMNAPKFHHILDAHTE